MATDGGDDDDANANDDDFDDAFLGGATTSEMSVGARLLAKLIALYQ